MRTSHYNPALKVSPFLPLSFLFSCCLSQGSPVSSLFGGLRALTMSSETECEEEEQMRGSRRRKAMMQDEPVCVDLQVYTFKWYCENRSSLCTHLECPVVCFCTGEAMLVSSAAVVLQKCRKVLLTYLIDFVNPWHHLLANSMPIKYSILPLYILYTIYFFIFIQ